MCVCVLVAQECLTFKFHELKFRFTVSSVHWSLPGCECWSVSFPPDSSRPRDLNPGPLYCKRILYHLSQQGTGIHKVKRCKNMMSANIKYDEESQKCRNLKCG